MSDVVIPLFPGLTPELCADLKALADPSGAGRLPPQKLLAVVQALKAAQSLAHASAAKAPRAEALDYLALAHAFASALATVELVHE